MINNLTNQASQSCVSRAEAEATLQVVDSEIRELISAVADIYALAIGEPPADDMPVVDMISTLKEYVQATKSEEKK